MFKGLREKLKIACERCGKIIVKKTPWHVTCSKNCRREAWLIREANKVMKKSLILIFLLVLSSPAFALEGMASWYSSESCKYNKDPKCPTASGRSLYELEKEKEDFAAMWNVPFGQRLQVSNLRTGKTVVVFVRDRGPSKILKNRIIDLSRSAFQKIADPKEGLIPVNVEVIQ